MRERESERERERGLSDPRLHQRLYYNNIEDTIVYLQVRHFPSNKYTILNRKNTNNFLSLFPKIYTLVRGIGRDDNDVFADSVHITNQAQAVVSSNYIVTTSPLLK